MHRSTQIICPACIQLPKWQWTLFTEADDFCEDHAWNRYPEIPVTDEEIEEAKQAEREAILRCPPLGVSVPLYLFFPDKLRRCIACGHEWVGIPNEYHLCRMGLDGESYYGPYVPNQADKWDDSFALPTHQGTHKRH